MPTDGFRRTAASLAGDSAWPSSLAVLAALALLAAWTAWFIRARLPVFAVSTEARLETAQAAYGVESPLDGRLVWADLSVGRRVKAGDPLARIENDEQRLERGETQSRVGALESQILTYQEELALSQRAGEEERRLAEAQLNVARAQVREAQAPTEFLDNDAERLRRLRAQGLIAEREFQRGASDAGKQRAAVETLQETLRRIEKEQQTRDRERDVRHQRLRSDIARMEGDIRTHRAGMSRLDYQIALRTVTAPVSGRIGEGALLRPGAWLTEGMRLAAIIPEGGLILVAQFAPAEAAGRVRPGQTARIRFQGFPWTQYGTLPATVVRVSDEIRDGKVRVEMAVEPAPSSPIPLGHGLPGSVEVEVERIAPLALAFRLAGVLAAEAQPARAAPGGVR
ncbi:MAG: HlyD family efflux transporter periplasmic adaptor subunit [Bryobacteraceae bacterium]